MKKLFSAFLILTYPLISSAQEFTLKVHISKGGNTPDLYYISNDDVLHNFYNRDYIALKKDSNNIAFIKLNPQKVAFFKIGMNSLMINPGSHIEGTFDGFHFFPLDSGTINFKQSAVENKFQQVKQLYTIGSDFEVFKSTLKKLLVLRDSTNHHLIGNIKPYNMPDSISALKEYISAIVAHFMVLPILFKNKYDSAEYRKLVEKNVIIKQPLYWIQLEPGRIFLETYYKKIVLPDANFNLQASLKNKFFVSPQIQKLAVYNYFVECLKKTTVKTKDDLLGDLKEVSSKYLFSNTEKEMIGDINKRVNALGRNISNTFSSLPLLSTDNKLLASDQKKALIARENIILDFWASWCVPCRKKMEELNSDKIKLHGKIFQIVYLSIDENKEDWEKVKYPFLNPGNSFRVAGSDNDFVREFKLSTIPRYILISNSGLISDNFEY